ncbi:MAG: GDP-mannose 4,6-dehydratase [Phycisphaerales bacterium]|nr:GDP-mannose 4,6-dehydratase [Planctomycetota bacterium]MCH8508138.1 GDP-mannose 4,6-dehydratase [Phycisphaerales bacterium]
MQDQRVIVTGAAGFIGSHTAGALLDRGATVLGLDNLDPFYDAAIKRRNLDALRARERGASFEHRDCDIRDASRVRAAFEAFRPNTVIHLAARAGVRPSIEDPAGYALTNVIGTQHILDAAEAVGCKRIVCASSSSVYGNNPKTPFAETDRVDEPISPYAATKKSCELIAHAHHRLTGASVAMLRFFTVFGPAQRPDLAISLFLSKIGAGEPIRVFGDGSTSRDYTYVDDIVAGVLAACERIDEHGYRVWNLGGDHPITLSELIDTVSAVVGRAPVIDRRPMQPGDVDRTWADLTRSRAELAYNPKTAVREGIERQLQWMRQHA